MGNTKSKVVKTFLPFCNWNPHQLQEKKMLLTI